MKASLLKRMGVVGVILLLFSVSGCEKEKKQRLKIGDQGPSFSALSINGKSIALSAYKGSPVILRFWSTDCKYCRADTPVFNHYFRKYKDKGLQVLYINSSPAELEGIKEFIADLDIRFPVILDHDGKISASYNVKIVPQTIILDSNHTIIAGILGGVSEAELQELLGPFLK